MPTIREFCDANNILWFPIDLKLVPMLNEPNKKEKKLNKINHKFYNFQRPKPTDFNTLSIDEIKDRQKMIDLGDWIAIDTRSIFQIDIDCDNYVEGYDKIMEQAPYFKSATKSLPHIFITVENLKLNKARIQLRNGGNKLFKNKDDEGVELLCGQWSYARWNDEMINGDLPPLNLIEIDHIILNEHDMPKDSIITELPKTTTIVERSQNNTNGYHKIINKFINGDLLRNTCDNHESWVLIGTHLKVLFEEDITLFQLLTEKYGTDNKKEECEKWWKEYIKPKYNDKIKALNTIKKIAKTTNESKYKEIMTQIKIENKLNQIENISDYIEYPQVDCFSEEINELINSNINKFIFQSTDVDLAKFFKLVYGKNHNCCSIKEKLWYNFNDKQNIWAVDDRIEVRHKISNDFYSLYDAYYVKLVESCESMDRGDRRIEPYQKLIKKINELKTTLRTTSNKNNILRELQEELFDGSFLKSMNKESYMLPTKNNKMLNMKTLEVTERTFENKFNFICDAEYIDLNEEQESDIRKYFMDLFVDNEKVMKCVLNIIKSSFTGVLLRYIFFHTGDGSNGKSLLFKIMSNIFPNIMNVINKDVILEKKSSSHINTEFEKLETCRLAYVSELKETDILNVTNIKSISGGDDINLRGICKSDRTITPVSTLHVLTNKLPKFEVEKAILNRIIMIPYKAVFKIDKSFEGTMLEKKSEIFSFIMKYGNIVDNLDDIPEEMIAMKNQYADDNSKDDYLQDFVNDKIEYDKDKKVLRDEFRLRYNHYCEKYKYSIDKSTNTKFTRMLKDKYNIISKESNGKVNYLGIDFKIEV
jgi:P4 family phage/plasmid primase-like protien